MASHLLPSVSWSPYKGLQGLAPVLALWLWLSVLRLSPVRSLLATFADCSSSHVPGSPLHRAWRVLPLPGRLPVWAGPIPSPSNICHLGPSFTRLFNIAVPLTYTLAPFPYFKPFSLQPLVSSSVPTMYLLCLVIIALQDGIPMRVGTSVCMVHCGVLRA